ncbi:MAG: DUF1800 domain-containing protein [Pseudomonadota bacterium]
MKDMATFQALNRFGLGPAPGEAAAVATDPRGWVTAQIRSAEIPAALTRFAGSADILVAIQTARMRGRDDLRKETLKAYRRAFTTELVSRAGVMIGSPAPFAERMVVFWSNHFTVSNTKPIIGPAIPAYEREAIRPHVFGSFSDMLKAVVRHPVMLSYLDNIASIGEGSRVGQRRRRRTGAQKTLNENLAREILELHTLGVNGGYSQQDVIELAKALSGWSRGGLRPKFENKPVHGDFEYRAAFHEPGPKTVLGKTYAENGAQEGLDILDDLARHPSTARFIATKLARHFVSDTPPENTIDALASAFQESDGDLAHVSHAVVELDETWNEPLSKVKSHYEFIVSAHRAMGNPKVRARDLLVPLREMAQVPFTAPSPAGWGDLAQDWVAPEALMRRIEWVRRYATRAAANLVPAQMLDDLIGPVAHDAVRLEVHRAATSEDALAMILASSEFQRR